MSGWGSAVKDNSAKVESGFNKKQKQNFYSSSGWGNSFTVATNNSSSSSGWGSAANQPQQASDVWRDDELKGVADIEAQKKRDALAQSKVSDSRKQQKAYVAEDSIASLFEFDDDDDDFPENLFGDDTSTHEKDVQAASDRSSNKKRGNRRMPGMQNFVAVSKATIHDNKLTRFSGASSFSHASHFSRAAMCYE